MESAEDLKEWIRAGLPFVSLKKVMERFGFNQEEISSALNLPPRTLARRKQEQRLHRDESDRLFRLVCVAARRPRCWGATRRPRGGFTRASGLSAANCPWNSSTRTWAAGRWRRCSAASSAVYS